MVYMGRTSVEKNIKAFLSLEMPGTELVIGDCPDLAMLKQKFSQEENLVMYLRQE